MNNIFNPDNKFFSFMGRVADLMILNLLCIVCCIPVVTAGPAIAAMYYITLKMARNEESYVVKGFFHSFKQNLKQGIVIQIIMLLLGIVLAFDLYFCRMMSGQGAVYRIFSYIFVAALFVYTMRFYGSTRYLQSSSTPPKSVSHSILMSIRHLPYTNTDDGDHCGTCITWNLCCTGLSIHDPVLHHARIRHCGIYQLPLLCKTLRQLHP